MSANDFKNCKLVTITPPAAIVNNGSYTTAEIDTKGFRHMRIIAHLGATDIAMTALKATESDSSGANHADVTGAVFGTSTDIAGNTSALPSATDDNKFFVIDLDLRGRKRYIDVTATAGNGSAGTFLTIWAELYRGEATPVSLTNLGAGGALSV
jgi:hypothetical protein